MCLSLVKESFFNLIANDLILISVTSRSTAVFDKSNELNLSAL